MKNSPEDKAAAESALDRLERLVNAEIDALEQSLQGWDQFDPEKRARALGALTRAVEKLEEVKQARAAQCHDEDGLDRDAVLAELERRLVRLVDAADASRRSQSAERDGS